MEEWFLSLCFTAASTLVALLFLWLSGGKRKPAVKRQLPPGPWTLPVIGSLHHVVSILPHRKMMDMSRRHGPLMHLTLGEVPTVIVSSAEAASLVMKTNGLTFAGRPRSATLDIFGCGGKGIFFAPYSDHCRQMRKLCNVELLSTKQVKQTEGIRAEEVGNLLRSITASNGAIVNVSKMAATLSNSVVTRAVFGGRFTKQDEYLRELDEALVLVGGFCLVDLFPSSLLVRWLSKGERRMRRCQGRIQSFISSIIDERKAARTGGDGARSTHHENLLDVLLRLQQENALEYPLTTKSIGAVLFDLFAGGTETTGNVLAWAMSELMRSPNTMAKAQREVREVLGEGRDLITTRDLSELHYMRKIIKEVLRLHPPGPLIPRMATEDCTVMGYDIPKGTVVHINVLAISQDPRYWHNPKEFRPERFDSNNVNYNGTYFEFIPFGAGRRQCPGIQFGSAITEMALTNLLYHFDWMLPDGASPASLDMSEKFAIAVSRRHDLKLRATPHVWFNVMSSK